MLLSSTFAFQNGFNLLKGFFIQNYNVNLDLILSILFPIGTITVIITLLIRNMLKTKVADVLQAIKTIDTKVSAFRIFYYTNGKKSLQDYTFVTQLPIIIKSKLIKNASNFDQGYELMTVVNDAAIFIEQNFTKEKERKYHLYRLFNEIIDLEEIQQIKNNVLKVKTIKQAKFMKN